MGLHNYKPASTYDVEKWLILRLELTPSQQNIMRDDELIRFAPFEFFERREKVNSIWLRLTIIFVPPVFILLFISLPFNFLITGGWGYPSKQIGWYNRWIHSIGL